MDIDQATAEAIIKTNLEAVQEQFITPLLLAMGTITLALSTNQELGQWVGKTLRMQVSTIPDDVAGKLLLQVLARAADGKDKMSPEE